MSQMTAAKYGSGEFPAAGPSRVAGSLVCRTRIIVGFGSRWRCPSSWHVPSRRLTDSSWWFVRKGRCRLRWGERLERADEMSSDRFGVLATGVRHEVEPLGGTGCVLDCVHFRALLDGVVDLCALAELTGVYEVPIEVLEQASDTYVREATIRASGWQVGCSAAVRQVLLELLRLGPTVGDDGRGDTWPNLGNLVPALSLLNDRIGDPDLRIADLAEAAGMSEPWLRTQFRATFRESPAGVVRRRRVEEACRLLESSDLPIKAIAGRCGFVDVPYFYRSFRRITGTTPARWRDTRLSNLFY